MKDIKRGVFMQDIKVEIGDKDKHEAKITFIDEDISMAHGLRELIIDDENVEFAAVQKEHPEITSLILIIRVKRGNPISVIEKAAAKLAKMAKDLRKTVK